MHIAIQGALIGLLVAVIMFVTDYFLIRKNAAERAQRRAQKTTQLEGTEKERIKTLFRYCLLVPAGFALAFWIIWG